MGAKKRTLRQNTVWNRDPNDISTETRRDAMRREDEDEDEDATRGAPRPRAPRTGSPAPPRPPPERRKDLITSSERSPSQRRQSPCDIDSPRASKAPGRSRGRPGFRSVRDHSEPAEDAGRAQPSPSRSLLPKLSSFFSDRSRHVTWKKNLGDCEPFYTHLTSVESKRAPTHPAQRTGASTCRSFGAGMAPHPAKGTTRSLASPRPLSMIAAEALPPTHPRRPLVPGAFGPDPLRGPRGGRLRAFGTISE